ncbi:MAG: imelysin family protein [Lautropia sp.]
MKIALLLAAGSVAAGLALAGTPAALRAQPAGNPPAAAPSQAKPPSQAGPPAARQAPRPAVTNPGIRLPAVAAPYYGPEAFTAALSARGQAPLAARFDASARQLAEQLAGSCPASGDATAALRGAQPAWLAAADDWERLDAIAVGATIARRSERAIDFRPVRPRLVVRAISDRGTAAEPPDAAALAAVGTPAKGLPALEWLLWAPDAPHDAAACRYAVGVAREVAREAAALAAAHAADAARDWQQDGEAAAARATEAVNQWLAGLEALRWRQLGKPLAVVESQPAAPLDTHRDIWPRPPSASHRAAWQARWQSLRALAAGAAPTDGFGPQPAVAPALISLEALLRGRGRNADADAWATAIGRADRALAALLAVPAGVAKRAAGSADTDAAALPSRATMRAAVAALDAVRRLMQARIAPALQVTLGFSDADGD